MDCRSRSDCVLSTVKRLRQLKSLTNTLKRSIKCLIPTTIRPFFDFDMEECQDFVTPIPNDSKNPLSELDPVIPLTTNQVVEPQAGKDVQLSEEKNDCTSVGPERKSYAEVDISFIPVTVESFWDFDPELENEVLTTQTDTKTYEVNNTTTDNTSYQKPELEWQNINQIPEENNNLTNIKQSNDPELLYGANTQFMPITITPFFDLGFEVEELKLFYDCTEVTPKEFEETLNPSQQQTDTQRSIDGENSWHEFKNEQSWTSNIIQFNPIKDETSHWDIKTCSPCSNIVSVESFKTISTFDNSYDSNMEEKYTIQYNYEINSEINNLKTDQNNLSLLNTSLHIDISLPTRDSDTIEEPNNILDTDNENSFDLKEESDVPITKQSRTTTKCAVSSIQKRKCRQLHNIQKHVISDTCFCKKKCSDFLSDETREKINKHYWNASTEEQRVAFVKDLITVTNVKRRRSKKKEASRRNNSFKFYLPKYIEFELSVTDLVEVCKSFFLSTLGYKKNNDSVLRKLRTTNQLSSR